MPYTFSRVKKFLDPSKFAVQTQVIGKVVGKTVCGRVSVAVQLNRFNPWLKMYFPESQNLHVSDPDDKSLLGDVVMVSKLDAPRRTVETHEIKDIIYTVGHLIDPLTGLRCNKQGYLDEKVEDGEFLEMRKKMQNREISHEYSYEHNPRKMLFIDQTRLKAEES